MVSAPFCPYCGTRRDERPRPGAAAAAGAAATERLFTTSQEYLHLAFDPRAGYALLGSYAPDSAHGRLRAYDFYRKRVAWNAFTGERGTDDLDYEKLAVHKGHVYASVGRSFRVLDLLTGQQKWGAELPDKVAYDRHPLPARGARVFDPAPPGARGPVWIVATDDTISAFDRDTGQPLWRETRERMPRRILPYESGLLLLDHRHEIELVDPATRTVIDKVGPRVERLDVDGRYGLLQVECWGWREREGVLVHDFLAKKEVLFEAVDGLDDDVPCVSGNNRVFCAVEGGAKLFAAPHGKAVELMPGFRIRTMAVCGPTVVVLLTKHHGTSYRRVVGVDAQSLAVRFDLGEWASEPDDDWTTQVCSNGHVAVTVKSRQGREGDGTDSEVIAIDPGGRMLWNLPVGVWRAHWFLGGHVVVLSSRGWHIVRPDNGQVVAQYRERQDDDDDDPT